MHAGYRVLLLMVVLAAVSLAQSAGAGSGENALEQSAEKTNPEKAVYLTFDDGPSKVTLKILDVLKEHDMPATFFVCGNVTEFGRKAYKRILDEGHALGNHTFSHRYETIYASPEAFEQDVVRLDNLFCKFTETRPRLLRFPGGSNNGIAKTANGASMMPELVKRMTRQGYRHCDWNVDSKDYAANAGDADAIVKTVVEGVGKHDEAIVLMHDSYLRAATAKALPEIIRKVRARGYVFKTLSQESFNVQFLKSESESAK
ncbi:MAG: polysaccharide deacetylase family protein [Pirellulaceae bacterium]